MWLREAGWTEEMAQAEIAANPQLIDVPASWRVQQERPHGGGRPDIVFTAPANEAFAVVELQLGGVDTYHIAKSAEYFARERGASPQAEGCFILVAKRFDGRYARLAEAVARTAPLQLFRMSITGAAGAQTLQVHRHTIPELSSIPPEDETRELQWRALPWFSKADGLLEQIMSIDPAWTPKFNAQYIGGQRFGGRCNSIALRSDGAGFQIELKLERSADVDQILTRGGFAIEYRDDREHVGPRRRHYRVRISEGCAPEELSPLQELVLRAHRRWRRLERAEQLQRQG